MTPRLKLEWKRLLPKLDPNHSVGKPCGRSSHGVSWIPKSSRLVIYGGEHVARTPLEASDATWACDFDSDSNDGRWRAIAGAAPPERVAHSQAVHEPSSSLYVFGGRSGLGMDENPRNDLWKLDCSGPKGTETWSRVIPKSDETVLPEARSYHSMVCLQDSLYVFGGCSESGRLNDLHRFDIVPQTWHPLGSSKQLRGRGGATLLPLNHGRALGVVAGFAGVETSDGHSFDIDAQAWAPTALTLEGLVPRSVCVGGSVPKCGVSVLFGGEVDPSDQGHEGAGNFENDVVLLDESTGTYLETIRADPTAPQPEPRGWSSGAFQQNDNNDTGSLLVFGGLAGDDSAPKRLEDLWKLTIERA